MMKKIMALVVLGVFLLSMMPLVASQPEDRGRNAEDRMEAAKNRLEVAKNRLDQVKERVKNIREQAKERHETAKQRLEQVKECGDAETQECQQLRLNAKDNAREFLLSAADRMLNILAKAQERLEASSAKNKEEQLADLDERLAEVEAARVLIESLDDESTREEFQEATQTLREAWSKGKEEARSTVAKVARERYGGALKNLEKLEATLDKFMQRARTAGLNVSDIDRTDFDEAVVEVEDAIDVMNGYIDAGDMKNAAQQLQQVKNRIREAAGEVREIREQLREQSQEARGLLRKAQDEVEADDVDDSDSDDLDDQDESDDDDNSASGNNSTGNGGNAA
ncbi:hypothetical protein GF342_02780 [Candidatus Woesearchaeota archaeon]|nr:hypothetical protein [Candidatus Woesearchaeota archaeon]